MPNKDTPTPNKQQAPRGVVHLVANGIAVGVGEKREPNNADEPLTLKEACARLGSRFTPSTLRAAHARGEIAFERLGNKDFITIKAVNDWRQKCRSTVKGRTSISGKRDETRADDLLTSRDGLSRTDRARLAQASALAKTLKLKKPSPPTSPKNISRPDSADVIPLRSRSRTR